jgi:Dehydrogenases with different specificities (related to short-chain alcohol dehydrogenases)
MLWKTELQEVWNMAYLDKFSLAGKVALVTGGAYGIGFAIARALAKAGAQIAF